jgi:ribose transport system permease protein
VTAAEATTTDTLPDDEPGGVRALLGRFAASSLQSFGVAFALITLFVVTGLYHHLFWSANNMRVLALNASFVALVGVGTAILIITGNIDLSIGSMLGLTAVLAAIFSLHMPLWLAFVCAVLCGGALGAVNGVIVWNVSTSPLIITLGMLTLLRGVIYIVTSGSSITGMPSNFVNFGNSKLFGLETPIWVMIVAALVGFVFLTFTVTGRHVFAIGGNKDASRAAGVKIRRVVIGAFIANGLIVGLAGVLEASFYGSPDPTFGNGFELQVITAVIVGGVSFMGGEGGVLRAVLGALLIATVSGSVVSFGIDPNYAYVFTGAILIFAVSADQLLHRQRERFQKSMAMRERARFLEERRRASMALEDADAPSSGS